VGLGSWGLPLADCGCTTAFAMSGLKSKNNDGGHARLINWPRPVLGSRHEPSTVRVLFFGRATNHQRFAFCSWFAPRTINGLRRDGPGTRPHARTRSTLCRQPDRADEATPAPMVLESSRYSQLVIPSISIVGRARDTGPVPTSSTDIRL